MIGALSEVCAGLPDQRKGPRRDGDYAMADIGLAAFSVFFMGSPSFLGHQQALAEGTATLVKVPPAQQVEYQERSVEL